MNGSTRLVLLWATIACVTIGGMPGVYAQEASDDSPKQAENLADALKKGDAKISFRYRYENVSDDAVGAKEAHASTLRTALSYKTLPFKGFSVFLEAENVAEVGNDLYNNAGAGSLRNGVTDRPVVADPALTQILQAYLRLERGKTVIDLGRREINLGDHRFVGNVGWRQHHQSFDTLSITNTSLTDTTLSYSYVDKVHRIFGDSQPMSSHLLTGSFKAGGAGKLTLYGYLLDFDRPQDARRSTDTWGVELAGRRDAGSVKVLWELERAEQSDAGDNPRRIDAGYTFATVGVAAKKVTVKVGWEVLEGSSRDGQFNTPLATLHKFNGWADKFLATPTAGLEDAYLSLSGKAGKVAWTAVYHDFSAESGGASYGEEIDVQLTYSASWKQLFGFKVALYDADSHAADTDKLMFWTAYTF